MKIIEKEELYITTSLTQQLFDESSLFFDIETTGFSPAHSTLYMIGCAYRKGEKLSIIQYFAEKSAEESLILGQFLQLLGDFNCLISYNGAGFDLPYLKAKCQAYKMPDSFSNMQMLDIYKEVSHLKFLLKLPNYKQKSIESFLGIDREDKYSGGDLINIYKDYCKSGDPAASELLLLHNFEDVLGMTRLLPILSYQEILHGQYRILSTEQVIGKGEGNQAEKELLITLKNDYPAPKAISYQFEGFYLRINEDTTLLRIPIYQSELHFFYQDYHNYYYLPQEDLAMHKSVASFVDKEYREQAKAYNCYTRKAGEFLPQLTTIMSPVFKKDYKDKLSYFELSQDFASSDVMLRRYVKHILDHMMES